MGIASNKTEVLPDRLTSPQQAEALVPNARIRKASFLLQNGKNYINEYEVRGVLFDDFKNGNLIDYKANYSSFIGNDGQFRDWFSGRSELLGEANRQVNAANGTSVVWHVGENQVEAFRGVVGDIPGLIVLP
jgi:Restriction endonuclease fold toxin 5